MLRPTATVCDCVLLALLGSAGLLVALDGGAEAGGHTQPPSEKIRAVTLDAVNPPRPGFLSDLRDLGVTHLTLVSFGFQPGYTTPEIQMHNDARWFSESDTGIRALGRAADSLGLRLILKPHIWVGDYSTDGQSRHTIGFDTEADWQRWEAAYHRFLMHYARLAQDVDAAVLVVGTELANVVKQRPSFWRRLIADVRQVYDGKLTYAANWWEEYEAVPFWDALDYVGIQAYFELSAEERPTVPMLRDGWQPHKAAMQRLAARIDRPILFTELGYRNVSYAAAEPWRWPSRQEAGTRADSLQARLYQAFFESLWHEPWFAGAILWKWHPEGARGRRIADRLGFSPQNKPAEQVIARWFNHRDAPVMTSPR
jgi:hypothetical protein